MSLKGLKKRQILLARRLFISFFEEIDVFVGAYDGLILLPCKVVLLLSSLRAGHVLVWLERAMVIVGADATGLAGEKAYQIVN